MGYSLQLFCSKKERRTDYYYALQGDLFATYAGEAFRKTWPGAMFPETDEFFYRADESFFDLVFLVVKIVNRPSIWAQLNATYETSDSRSGQGNPVPNRALQILREAGVKFSGAEQDILGRQQGVSLTDDLKTDGQCDAGPSLDFGDVAGSSVLH